VSGRVAALALVVGALAALAIALLATGTEPDAEARRAMGLGPGADAHADAQSLASRGDAAPAARRAREDEEHDEAPAPAASQAMRDVVAAGPDTLAPAASTAAAPHDVGAPSAAEVEVDDEDDERGFTRVYAPDKDGIQAAMAEAKPLVRECYEAWLHAHPDLGGKIVVAFTITDPPDDDGDEARVTDVRLVDSSVDHAPLEGCILNVAASLRFERPEGGKLQVSYPFRFDNGE